MAFTPFDLTGRVVLITGGNAGIGLGIAEGLAQAGADICIWGTNAARNDDAAKKLKAHGTRVAAMTCNVADKENVERAFADTLSTFGRVDGCFANAGVPTRWAAFEDLSVEQWDQTMGVNLKGAFFVLQQAAKHMKKRAEAGDAFGRLITTASLAAFTGMPRGEDYAASKGAILALTRALAVEYARHGVTANAIVPGWIETAMTEPAFSSEKLVANVKSRIPARRFGTPQDFAGLAVYLMSTASAYHTGDTLVVDGGYCIF